MILIEFHRFTKKVIEELQQNLPGHLQKYVFKDCLVTATDTNEETLVVPTHASPSAYIRIFHDHTTRDIIELVRILRQYPRHSLYGYGILINSIGCYVPPDNAGHLP